MNSLEAKLAIELRLKRYGGVEELQAKPVNFSNFTCKQFQNYVIRYQEI